MKIKINRFKFSDTPTQKHDKIYNNAHQIKLLKSKDKGKILKASREKENTLVTYDQR